jgi:heat shock protein HslJ
MYDRTNQEVLGYVKAAPQSVVGPWIVLSVNNGTGGVTSVPAGVGGAFSFLENGSVEGFGGCNNFSGSYTVDGESIAIGPLMSTMKACDEATNTFESQLMIALQNSTKWSVSAGKLDLRDDSGAQQVSAETAIK